VIVETARFAFQAPYRLDLSGHPIGALFVWLGRRGRTGARVGYYEPYPHAREFGFYLPEWLANPIRAWRHRKLKFLECNQLYGGPFDPKTLQDDWRDWPPQYRAACEAAVAQALDERPGAKLVVDRSYAGRRIDLSGQPRQLYRAIGLEGAA
jgi:hypothetical protein